MGHRSFFQDPDQTELGKLLEMKGLRRSEQGIYLEQVTEVPGLPGVPEVHGVHASTWSM